MTSLLIILLISFTSCEGRKRMKEYGYIFQESTGTNEFILINGQRSPVKFSNTSDQTAVKTLHALRAGILYENSKGNQIFVVGDYDSQSQNFRLSHWYIKIPYEELVVEDETQLPHKSHTVVRQSLERTDFESKNGFDPEDPAFQPKLYQRSAQ